MKVGLVLEGGALRTIFSTGVFDALLEKNVMADYVVGVSAGIAYGVSYVSKQPRRNLEILTRFVNDRRYMGLNNLVDRHNRSYFGLEFSYCTIPNELVPFDYQTFEAFPGHVEAGVTNLETGQAEYKEVTTEDKHFRLLQATCAMPLMFPVFHLDGKPYLDGGAADAVPYRRAFEQGCDRVVVILTKPRSFVRKPERLLPLIQRRYREYPQLLPHHGGAAGAGQPEPCGTVSAGEGGQGPGHRPQYSPRGGAHRAQRGQAAHAVGRGLSAGHGEYGADPLLHGSMIAPSPGASRAKASSISPSREKKAAIRSSSSRERP